MSLYPSLEDMKVDHLVQAQHAAIRQHVSGTPSEPESSLPYPVNPGFAPMYPGLADYMGLELTEEVLRANMPEYLSNGATGNQIVRTQQHVPVPTKTLEIDLRVVTATAMEVFRTIKSTLTQKKPLALSRSFSDYVLSTSSSFCLPLKSYDLDKYSDTEEDDGDDHGFATYNQLAYPQSSGTSSGSMVAPLSASSPAFAKSQLSHGVRQVILCKDADGKVGLRVKSINKGIFVCLVTKNSPAAMGGLRFGDQILQINGENVAGFTEDKVHTVFRKASVNNIVLAVRDRPFERTLTLHKDSSGHLGFQFKDGKISAIAVDSSAARNGMLIDHNLLEVNGQNVVAVKDKEISKIIDEGGQIVTVTVIPNFLYQHIIKNISGSMMKKKMDHSIPDM